MSNSTLEHEDRWDYLESLNNRFELNREFIERLDKDTPEYKKMRKLTDEIVEEIEALIGLKNQN